MGCLCTMRESCSECEGLSSYNYTPDEKQVDKTKLPEFGSTVYVIDDREREHTVLTGKFIMSKSVYANYVMIEGEKDLYQVEIQNMCQTEAEALKKIKGYKMKSLMKDITQYNYSIETYTARKTRAEKELEELKKS